MLTSGARACQKLHARIPALDAETSESPEDDSAIVDFPHEKTSEEQSHSSSSMCNDTTNSDPSIS
eukprot:9125087-Karenia_brevis.AAC.1